MFQSLKLGKCFGIDLYVHPTFWLLPLFVLFGGLINGSELGGVDGVAYQIMFIFAVFGCIVLHEVGHALAAKAYNIGTRDITLYPIGGVASLERMPEKPGREIAIALAGPAVNIVIAAALFIGLKAGIVLAAPTSSNLFESLAIDVLQANLFLCVFNLIPAFPMDGGRVLRALLAIRMSRLRATTVAVGVGTFVSGVFLVIALITRQPGLFILAVVVYLLGQAELAMVRMREAGRDLRERFEGYFASPEDEPDPSPHAPPSPGFSGLAWDATRRVWVEWKNGVPVGAIPSGR